jgi:hypothetical protein
VQHVKRYGYKLAANKEEQLLMPLLKLRAQVGFLIIKFPANYFRLSKPESPIFTENTCNHDLSPIPSGKRESLKTGKLGSQEAETAPPTLLLCSLTLCSINQKLSAFSSMP